MIFYLPIDRAFSFRPFIVLPTELKTSAKHDAILMHEQTHYGRMRICPPKWTFLT
jgi:hypothetical protein